MNRTLNITLSPSMVLRATLVVIGVLLALYFFQQLIGVGLLLLAAIMLATAIEPLVNWLRRGPFNRTAGILVVYTGIILLLITFAWLTIPVIIAQVTEVVNQLPNYAGGLREMANQAGNPFVKAQLTTVASALEQVSKAPAPAPSGGTAVQQVQQTGETILKVAEVVFGVLASFVIAFYWLTERTLIKRSLMALLPAERANRVRRVWDDIEVKVGGWVRGQLTLMTIVGVVSAVGYFGLGLKYWPVLAVFILVCEAIPLVGPYIGTAPAILVALTQTGNDGLLALLNAPDPGNILRAGLVVVFAIVLQTVEGNVLVPPVMKNSVGISPLTVIVSILVGAALGGLAGAALAVPLAGAAQVILTDLRAAGESDAALLAQTEAAAEIRAADDELVIATPAPGGGSNTHIV